MNSAKPARLNSFPASDLCWRLQEKGDGGAARASGYTWTNRGLSAPSSSHKSDLSHPFPSPCSGQPMEDRRGSGVGVVFQQRCTGQPAFIRMNQQGDKISPVTKLGYEIRVLIEFSSPGQGSGGSKYHWA